MLCAQQPVCLNQFPWKSRTTEGVNVLPQRWHFAACQRHKTPEMLLNVFPHMLSSSAGKEPVSSVPTGFHLIQLVFTVSLRRKRLHISTALNRTKDTHSRNLVLLHRETPTAALPGRPHCAPPPPLRLIVCVNRSVWPHCVLQITKRFRQHPKLDSNPKKIQ